MRPAVQRLEVAVHSSCLAYLLQGADGLVNGQQKLGDLAVLRPPGSWHLKIGDLATKPYAPAAKG